MRRSTFSNCPEDPQGLGSPFRQPLAMLGPSGPQERRLQVRCSAGGLSLRAEVSPPPLLLMLGQGSGHREASVAEATGVAWRDPVDLG